MIDYTKFIGHTPGPWGHYYNNAFRKHVLVDANKNEIGRMHDGAGESMNLIAAAPDLLDENKVLRELLENVKRFCILRHGLTDYSEAFEAGFKEAQHRLATEYGLAKLDKGEACEK